MTLHRLEPERRTLHGHWSKDLPPVLTIDPGDAVDFVTLDAAWGVAMPATPRYPDLQFEPRDPELDAGHALTGPVYIRGAQPGMMLAITVEELVTGSWGWNGGGGDWLAEDGQPLGDMGAMHWNLWQLDMGRMAARNQSIVTVRMTPFLGVMGMAPAAPGVAQYSSAANQRRQHRLPRAGGRQHALPAGGGGGRPLLNRRRPRRPGRRRGLQHGDRMSDGAGAAALQPLRRLAAADALGRDARRDSDLRLSRRPAAGGQRGAERHAHAAVGAHEDQPQRGPVPCEPGR